MKHIVYCIIVIILFSCTNCKQIASPKSYGGAQVADQVLKVQLSEKAVHPFWPLSARVTSEEYHQKQEQAEQEKKHLREELGLPPEVNTHEEVQKIVQDLRKHYEPFMRELSPCPQVRQIQPLDGEGWRFMYERGMISREDWVTGELSDKMPWPYGEEEQNTSAWATIDFDDSKWLEVTVPEYRGPRNRWTGWYRKRFTMSAEWNDGKRIALRFFGVDWKTEVYLNGELLGGHTGANEPFEFDITGLVKFGQENILSVKIINGDAMAGSVCADGMEPTQEYGPWYLPLWRGFHSGINGAGIWQKVLLAHTDDVWIEDNYARPNVEESSVTVTVSVQSKLSEVVRREVKIAILPRNFEGERIEVSQDIAVQPGENVFTFRIELPFSKLWTTDTPYLYHARVKLQEEGKVLDVQQTSFGMRSFIMETEGKHAQKGTLYLNGEQIFLRGGYSPRLPGFAVTRQYDDIVDDLLLLKAANCNLIRMHGFQYQTVIYEYCDMLGMLALQDHGLGNSELGKNVPDLLYEQTATMAKLTRNHPSVIMVELANEMYLTESYVARSFEIIRSIDPDRVIKPTDSPPIILHPEGFPDEHTYKGWYVGDGFGTVSDLYGKRLIPEGWRGGIGEYGVEGLDSWETMEACYEREWYPDRKDAQWDLASLPCVGASHIREHIPAQETCEMWIRKSQEYQALLVGMLTELWRRRAQEIVYTCHYLTIDWMPDGWLKAVVGYDRRPKMAFHVLRQCFQPLFVHIEGMQTRWIGGETTDFNIWVCNDHPRDFKNYKLEWFICDPQWKTIYNNEKVVTIKASGAEAVEQLNWRIPEDAGRCNWHILLICRDEQGKVVSDYQRSFLVIPHQDLQISPEVKKKRIGVYDPEGSLGRFLLSEEIPYGKVTLESLNGFDLVIIGKNAERKDMQLRDAFLRFAQAGGRLLLLESCEGTVSIRKGCNEIAFADVRHPIFEGLDQEDFRFWKKRGVVGEDLRLVCRKGLGGQGDGTIAISDGKSVMEDLEVGEGRVVISQLNCLDRAAYHPVARLVLKRMIEYLCLTKDFQNQEVYGSNKLAAYLARQKE